MHIQSGKKGKGAAQETPVFYIRKASTSLESPSKVLLRSYWAKRPDISTQASREAGRVSVQCFQLLRGRTRKKGVRNELEMEIGT